MSCLQSQLTGIWGTTGFLICVVCISGDNANRFSNIHTCCFHYMCWDDRSSSEWTSFSGNAITALTFANYILDPFYPECLPPPEAVRLIAACLICKPFLTFTFHLPAFKHQTKNWSSGFLTAVNCWNVKWATRVQDVATVTKVLSRFLLWGMFWLKDFSLSLSRSPPYWSLLLLVWSSLPSAPAPILQLLLTSLCRFLPHDARWIDEGSGFSSSLSSDARRNG